MCRLREGSAFRPYACFAIFDGPVRFGAGLTVKRFVQAGACDPVAVEETVQRG